MAEAEKQAISFLAGELNQAQQEAVFAGDEPLLIVAGAGTGKTATLAYRVAYKIASGVSPARILLLTFTRRAASEMLRRVDALLLRLRQEKKTSNQTPGPASGKVWGGTFHAVATRLLRIYGQQVGISPSFTILDRTDAEDLIGLLRTELGLAKSHTRFPLKGTCMDIYSRCVNTRQSVEEVVEEAFPWCKEHVEGLRMLFSAYVDRKARHQVLDYDDLLVYWLVLLENASTGQKIRKRFHLVLVDEYQDTNILQAEILKLLCPEGKGLTVVGDDAQAIYSFRGATVRNILDFPNQFPGCRIVKLEQNYRSTQPLLNATNAVIALAKEKLDKTLYSHRKEGPLPQLVMCLDEDEQTRFIVQQVLAHREAGIKLRQQAVLFRASHHSLALEVELAARNIPFRKYGGLRFIETAHVKDLLAYLRIAENPADKLAAVRVLSLFAGIGPKTANKLADMLTSTATETKSDVFSCWRNISSPTPTRQLWFEFLDLLSFLVAIPEPPLAEQIKRIRQHYEKLACHLYDNFEARLLDLRQLGLLAERFKNRSHFLTELTLDPPSYSEDFAADPILDEDFLVLSTMHSAKGLEWDVVYIIHASDGNIPSDLATRKEDEIEEERRLFYVALTRAKTWLYVCHPLRYYLTPQPSSDIHGFSLLTRFLGPEVLMHFERKNAVTTIASTQEAGAPYQKLDADDMRRRLKSQF